MSTPCKVSICGQKQVMNKVDSLRSDCLPDCGRDMISICGFVKISEQQLNLVHQH